jgi:hypothetical protein
MTIRVQVILQQDEAARFRAQALRESKSLSAWLRDAGKMMIEMRRETPHLNSSGELEKFFHDRNQKEQGAEPSWEDHKRLVLEGFQGRTRP